MKVGLSEILNVTHGAASGRPCFYTEALYKIKSVYRVNVRDWKQDVESLVNGEIFVLRSRRCFRQTSKGGTNTYILT